MRGDGGEGGVPTRPSTTAGAQGTGTGGGSGGYDSVQ